MPESLILLSVTDKRDGEFAMNIKTEISSKYSEIELHICSNELSDEVKRISAELHTMYDEKIPGTDEKGSYESRDRLYELEELTKEHFIRISKSEIVNIRKIRSLDMSITGTIRIIMKNGYETYASRRNVSKLKARLQSERTVNRA